MTKTVFGNKLVCGCCGKQAQVTVDDDKVISWKCSTGCPSSIDVEMERQIVALAKQLPTHENPLAAGDLCNNPLCPYNPNQPYPPCPHMGVPMPETNDVTELRRGINGLDCMLASERGRVKALEERLARIRHLSRSWRTESDTAGGQIYATASELS